MAKQRDPETHEPVDPDVETGTADVPTEASDTGKRTLKDSDPIPESKWAPPGEERPYADAITPEHKAFLDGREGA